jgi:hypothetical protein
MFMRVFMIRLFKIEGRIEEEEDALKKKKQQQQQQQGTLNPSARNASQTLTTRSKGKEDEYSVMYHEVANLFTHTHHIFFN